ncbi:hypothetical protein ABBQ38_005147 [Trebouxia sp. C0009 RCD-2024]
MTSSQASSCLLPSCPHAISSRGLRRPAPQQREGRRQVVTQAAAQGSTFGQLFRVTTYGTSHGLGVGCIVDGCPPRLPISVEEIQGDLDRRRPGQSRITTPRKESDTCEIVSGVSSSGWTEGDPIHITVPNATQRSQDYAEMEVAYRPSHADATYDMKYGTRAVAGGGRASARETIGRVAAGAIAKKLLKQVCGTEVLGYVSRVKDVESNVDEDTVTSGQIESNAVRCPDTDAAEQMYKVIDDIRKTGDSCGGEVTCIVRRCPKGLGAPVFGKLEAELAGALMSLPASKGFEIGSGFAGSRLLGSEHNDEFYMAPDGQIRTRTNRSGGVQGGISNGENIVLRVAFKPTATISKNQKTVGRAGVDMELRARGRHDPCVVPRAVPMVEAMVALVLADHLLQHFAQCELLPRQDSISPDTSIAGQFKRDSSALQQAASH